jgi:hypothetical protein
MWWLEEEPVKHEREEVEEEEEEEEGQEEYFDVEKKRWVRVRSGVPGEDPSETPEPRSEQQGWVTVDTGSYGVLRGRGERKATPQVELRSLKAYVMLGLTFSGMLAVSGRFIESAVALAITLGVAFFGRAMLRRRSPWAY